MVIVIFTNFISYLLLLNSLFIFDTFDYVEKRYYNNYFLYNFIYHPYGELVDNCHQNDFKDNFMFYMFDFNQTKYYWIDYYQNLGKMNDMKISKPFSELTNLTERVNNMNLNEFIYRDIDKNDVMYWDFENDEQINYFLYPLKEYKQFKTIRKIYFYIFF